MIRLIYALTLAFSPPLLAAAPAKSGQCAACHGVDGRSAIAANPVLRCQHEAYLVSALNAYRSGTRKYPVMNSIANTLQPKDIKSLAAWYANQPGCRK